MKITIEFSDANIEHIAEMTGFKPQQLIDSPAFAKWIAEDVELLIGNQYFEGFDEALDDMIAAVEGAK